MPELLQGDRVLQSLPTRIQASNVLVLTFGGAKQCAAIVNLLEAWRPHANLLHLPFSTPLLTVAQVADLANRVHELEPLDLLVSIGGGAVQDAAKCLKLLLDCGIAPNDLLAHSDRNWKRDTLHVAVPTTSGTGSEATCFATVYEGETKHSVEDPRLLPSLVMLDPSLLGEVPRTTAIYCGFDALAQAMESIWSIHATAESLGYALAAVEAILAAFPAAIAAREPSALARMQEAAYLSGKAIQISRTTLAHALSYPLSARFGLPHGLAVFLNLPRVIRFNATMTEEDCQDPQGIGHYQSKMDRLLALFGAADHEALAQRIEAWFLAMEVSLRFDDHGISSQDLAGIVLSAHSSSRSGNNPRKAALEVLNHEVR